MADGSVEKKYSVFTESYRFRLRHWDDRWSIS